MKQLRRIGALFAGLIGQVLLIITVTFVVLSGTVGVQSRSLHVLYRYLHYIGDLFTFSLGITANNVPVEFYIVPAIGRSIAVLVVPVVLAVLIALWLARRDFVRGRGKLGASAGTILAFGYSIPIPFLAVLLFAFAGTTGWLPMGMTSSIGNSDFGTVRRVLDWIHHLILPWITVGIFPLLIAIGAAGSRLASVRQAAYVEAAFARGFSREETFRNHVRRPVLAGVIQQLAASMPLFITFLALAESVYSYTGLGFYLVRAFGGTTWRMPTDELLIAQAALVYIAIFSVTAQFLCRVLVQVLIPQLREQQGRRNDRDRMIAAVGSVAVLLGIAIALLPTVSAPGAIARWAFAALPLLAIVVLLAVSKRRAPALEPSTSRVTARRDRESSTARTSDSESEGTSARSGPVRSRTDIRQLVKKLWPVLALAALVAFAYVLGEPEPLPALARVNPQAVPVSVRAIFYARSALMVARSIVHILTIAMASTIVAFLLAVVEVRKSPPFLHQLIAILGLFPVIILIALLQRTPGGFAAFLLMFLFVGIVRHYPEYRSRAILLQKQSYVTYSDVLGRNEASIFSWHFLPNVGGAIPRDVFILAADLVVLRANLNFVGIWVPWDYSRRLSSGEITLSVFDQFGARAYQLSWGQSISRAVRSFIGGYYLPVVFPLLLLFVTVALLRASGASMDKIVRGRSMNTGAEG